MEDQDIEYTIVNDCAYCDPENPSALAKSFTRGQNIQIGIDVSENIAKQMMDNGDLTDGKLEDKSDNVRETKPNPWSQSKEPETSAQPENNPNDPETEDPVINPDDVSNSEDGETTSGDEDAKVDTSDVDEIASLRKELSELGAEVDNRWKETRLRQEIKAAQNDQNISE